MYIAKYSLSFSIEDIVYMSNDCYNITVKNQKGVIMAEQDIAEKALEACTDVFADIVNTLLFHGKPVIQEDDLTDGILRSHYKSDGKLHEQERDVAKYWKGQNMRIAFLGFENQTDDDADMPLRVISYDGAAYRAQLLKDKTSENKKTKDNDFKNQDTVDKIIRTQKVKQRYPVVTLVLYFGYKKRWTKSKSLLECLTVPEELRTYVNDYRINLFEIAYLSDEQVSMFKSDFRLVADYFVQKRKNKKYIAPQEHIIHVHEFLQLMAVLTGDQRFEQTWNKDMEGRPIRMCEILDRIENAGYIRGKDDGLKEGERQTLNAITIMRFLIDQNRSEDFLRFTEDTDFRAKLMSEFFPKDNNH